MKRLVNGEEVEFDANSPTLLAAVDGRFAVRSDDGVRTALSVRSGDRVLVSYLGRQFVVEPASSRKKGGAGSHTGELRASMPGAVTEVCVSVGQAVIAGDRIVVLEAMKTHQAYVAPFNGVVAVLQAVEGAQVAEGDLLAEVSPNEAG